MNRSWIMGMVIAAHVAVVGMLCMQGCGTPPRPVELGDPPTVMPPVEPIPPRIRPSETPLLPPPPRTPLTGTRTPTRTPTAPMTVAPDVTTTYTVAKGDSLSVIAKRFGVTAKQVATLNKIKDPNKIRVGQKLLLPGKINLNQPIPERPAPAIPAPSSRAGTTAAPALTGAEGVYVIKKGDSLSTIARAVGVPSQALAEANNITNPNRIVAGQRLVIPGDMPVTVPSPSLLSASPEPFTPPPVEAATPAADPFVPAPVTTAVAPAPERLLPPPPPAVSPTPDASAYRIHEVKEDEDARTVAMLWGISTARLMEVNQLTGQELQVGQRLRIPNQ